MTANDPESVPATAVHVLPIQAWAIAAFLLTFFFICYIQHNDFPDFYHTSEPLKVDQVLTGEYNLRHPLLMLNTDRLVMHLLGKPQLRQSAVITGRTCSAFFAAAAVGVFSLWGFLHRGVAGAWLVGVLVGLQPGLLIAAHYLKEDPYLLFGLACTFLALPFYERRPTLAHAAWLGVACAIAVSGKYIGIFAIVLAITLIQTIGRRRLASLGVLLGAFVLTFSLINFQIFQDLVTLHSSVSKEVELLYIDHGESYLSWNKTRYFEMLVASVPWIFLALSGYRIVQTFREKPRAQISDIMFAVVPILYLLGLSLFPKGADRYFLPVSTMLFCLAGLAVADLGRLLSSRWLGWPRLVHFLLLAVLVKFFCWLGFSAASREFRQDNRQMLADWVRKNVPPTATIATDNRVAIPQPDDARYRETGNYVSQKILLGKRFAAEAGTIADLQARGVQYVAVAKDDYERLFKRTDLLSATDKLQLEKYQKFYKRLFKDGDKIWSVKKGRNRFLQPGLDIYKLPDAAEKS